MPFTFSMLGAQSTLLKFPLPSIPRSDIWCYSATNVIRGHRVKHRS